MRIDAGNKKPLGLQSEDSSFGVSYPSNPTPIKESCPNSTQILTTSKDSCPNGQDEPFGLSANPTAIRGLTVLQFYCFTALFLIYLSL